MTLYSLIQHTVRGLGLLTVLIVFAVLLGTVVTP